MIKIVKRLGTIFLISIILLSMVFVLTGCSDEMYFVNLKGSTASSCPNNAWCEEHLYTNDITYLDYLYTNDTIWVEYT
jgi:hypothetical protein